MATADAVQIYLQRTGATALFEDLMAQVIRTMPPDPARFVLEYLQRKLGLSTQTPPATTPLTAGPRTSSLRAADNGWKSVTTKARTSAEDLADEMIVLPPRAPSTEATATARPQQHAAPQSTATNNASAGSSTKDGPSAAARAAWALGSADDERDGPAAAPVLCARCRQPTSQAASAFASHAASRAPTAALNPPTRSDLSATPLWEKDEAPLVEQPSPDATPVPAKASRVIESDSSSDEESHRRRPQRRIVSGPPPPATMEPSTSAVSQRPAAVPRLSQSSSLSETSALLSSRPATALSSRPSTASQPASARSARASMPAASQPSAPPSARTAPPPSNDSDEDDFFFQSRQDTNAVYRRAASRTSEAI
eukprot:m.75774 g.75774  ORF g.75774 m.75774 type:complete len:368 (+) comp13144_c0_seq2:31-1134(+)